MDDLKHTLNVKQKSGERSSYLEIDMSEEDEDDELGHNLNRNDYYDDESSGDESSE